MKYNFINLFIHSHICLFIFTYQTSYILKFVCFFLGNWTHASKRLKITTVYSSSTSATAFKILNKIAKMKSLSSYWNSE